MHSVGQDDTHGTDDIKRIAERLEQEFDRLDAEIARLKRGDFTPEEFQALCHNRDEKPGCTRAEFAAGCMTYQR